MDYRLKENFNLFAGIHKGFSPPGSKEGTNPEESINYEVGTRFSNNLLNFQAVGFINDYSNLLGSDLAAAGGAGTTDQFNGGEALVRGLEFDLQYRARINGVPNLFFPISASYTYTHGTFQNDFDSEFDPWGEVSSGDELPYLPKNQFSFNIGLESRRASVDISSKYVGEMRTVAGQAETTDSQNIDANFVTDVAASFFLNKNVTFFGSIRNAFDNEYEVARRPAGLRPGMPRSFILGVKTTF